MAVPPGAVWSTIAPLPMPMPLSPLTTVRRADRDRIRADREEIAAVELAWKYLVDVTATEAMAPCELAERHGVLGLRAVRDIGDLAVGGRSADRERAEQRLVGRVVLDEARAGRDLTRCGASARSETEPEPSATPPMDVAWAVAAERQRIVGDRGRLVADGGGGDPLGEGIGDRKRPVIGAHIADAVAIGVGVDGRDIARDVGDRSAEIGDAAVLAAMSAVWQRCRSCSP